MARLSKEERRKCLKKWKSAERTSLVESMPLSPEQLNALLDYLSANLKTCDHTTKLTDIFLHVEKLDKNLVLPWLAEHGGYCDCEVLYNLEDLAGPFLEEPTPPKKRAKAKRSSRDLGNATGWNLGALPKPWRIANLHNPDEPLKLQLGKKGGCTITIIESPMPPADTSFDDFWSKLWCSRTELSKKGVMQISHESLNLPSHLRSTIVQNPGWTPVYCWIVPDSEEWHLEIRTEWNRLESDLPQIASLIVGLEAEKASASDQ